MWNNMRVIDVHSHVSPPDRLRRFAAGLMSNRGAATVTIADEIADPGFLRHIANLDERNIDFQLIGARPVEMWHWMPLYLQDCWARATNDLIAQCVRLHPDRFAGMAHLPQDASAPDTTHTLAELEYGVKELGFVGAYLNPDPDGKRNAPGVNQPYWFPLYEKCIELGVQILVHPCPSEDPRFHGVPAGYQMNNVIEEYVATMLYLWGGVFDRYPELKICISHCGGALQRFIPTDHHNSAPDKDFSNNLFFDSNSPDPVMLEAAIKQRGVSQICFGTEVPGAGGTIRPETGKPGDDLIPTIDAIPWLTDADKKAIFRENPLKVFPKVKPLVD